MIRIDEALCDGCGNCVPSCEEGALAIIDGKAKLVSEVYCDGLGACLGDCPQDALSIVDVEAAAFDQQAVDRHLAAMKAEQAAEPKSAPPAFEPCGCPGSRSVAFDGPGPDAETAVASGPQPSQLRQWPVQLHLVSPHASYFQGAEVLLAADCTAFAVGDFHDTHLKGRSLAVACPKLDSSQEIYVDKLAALVDEARISSFTVMIMQVPCCQGLLRVLQAALARAQRSVPVRVIVVGIQGEILADEQIDLAA